MQQTTSTRLAIALSLSGAVLSVVLWPCMADAQIVPDPNRKTSAAIPATAPTSLLPVAPLPPATPAQRPPQRADVTYNNGQLAINANNSSLNQILREISRTTGIKITGGVAEDRVFGKYGPAAPAEVLNTLLDGAGSNVLMIASDSGSAGELILTPRHGTVTPPNPNAPGFDDEAAEDAPQPQVQQPVAQPAPVATAPANTGTPAPANAAPAAPDASSPTDAQSPNAVKTPQQIYDQLQKLRQQQQPQPQQ
jgi:hypothetical protein